MGWFEHRLQRGIEQYAQEHGWHLSPDVTREKVVPWGWTGDGILAWLGVGDDLAEFVVQAKKPTVDFSFRRSHLKFARVLMDHAGISRLVAEHFLSRGFTHFVFYSDYDNWSWEERGNAFVEALRQAGKKCSWLRWHQSAAYFPAGRYEEWKRKRQWLASELKKAPKPLAVFAATDWMAIEVLETCEGVRLSVPDQVAIVGSDNSLLAVDTMRTPISTVEPNLEAMGYQGAALLDELMDGKPPPQEPIRIAPAYLIARKSSDLLAVNHESVARSLRFIWEHYQEPISVEDLVKVAAMSRRSFHQAFLEHVGRPPGNELHRVRIEHAKQLLTESKQKMGVIAELCGYQSANSFCVAFKQATGVSPREYHKKMAVMGKQDFIIPKPSG
jgi:LacI family transcriptional regulator